MLHVSDVFKYVCVHAGNISELDHAGEFKAPHESLVDVLVKLRVVRVGGGPQRARDLQVQGAATIYDSLYKAFMESKS
jgi:hypothetical protein